MPHRKRTKAEARWAKKLGERIWQLIEQKGYQSHYQFWTEVIGEDVARSVLHYICEGAVDAKISTLRIIATGLDVPLKELFDFEGE